MSEQSFKPSKRVRVAVLGATGAVGQSFIRLLVDHPWFELTEVVASERSAGKPYAEAARWIGADPMPASVAKMVVKPLAPEHVSADVVFSALDSSVAGDAEPAFAKAGKTVRFNRPQPRHALLEPAGVYHTITPQRHAQFRRRKAAHNRRRL